MKKIIAIIALTILLITFITTPAAAWKFDIPSSVRNAIERMAKIKHPDSFGQQSYYRNTQSQSWIKIDKMTKDIELKERQLKRIKHDAAIKWPDDYEMQYYRIRKQIAAWRSFEDFERPDGFKTSFKFKKLKKEYKRKYPNDYEMRLYKFKETLAAGI